MMGILATCRPAERVDRATPARHVRGCTPGRGEPHHTGARMNLSDDHAGHRMDPAEWARNEAETAREGAERRRALAEDERTQADQHREFAEESRIVAEELRASAESIRQDL